MEVKVYTCIMFALDLVNGQLHSLDTLPYGKVRCYGPRLGVHIS